jgi:outer membrane protein
MKKQALKGALAAILGTATVLAAVPAAAYQAGDMIVRAGLAGVLPTGDGTIGPGQVEADNGYSLGINFTYMATSNIGVEVLGSWPFSHDIEGKGGLAGAGKVAEIKHLPPTVTLQYHFGTGSKFHPYVGAGINYTNFFDIEETSSLGGDSLDLDDSWGVALEAGVDYELQNDWMVGAAVWWVDIDTDATITGAGSGLAGTYNVSIDPWVFMLSVGKKF